MTKAKQVFISHATADAQFAHRLADDLRRLGVQVWIAQESIRPGESWVDAIEPGLEESSHTVIVLTPKALKSRWVKKETKVTIAQELKGRIQVIPLDLEGHTGPETDVAFGPDEATLASGSWDGTVRLWGGGNGLREVQRTGGIERGSAGWRRARKGFRVFRASLFPRCRGS
jgi:hypothetical protein